MFSLRLLNRTKSVHQMNRLVCNYPILRDSKPTNTVSNVEIPSPKSASENPSVMGRRYVTPSNRDKKILVWMKYYKSIDEVPDKVTYETLDKAQNWFRIRCANWMMIATILGTIGVVYYGKKRAERGESLDQINIDWHNKINKEYQAGLANTEAAGAEKK